MMKMIQSSHTVGQQVPSALLQLAKAANRVTIGTVANIPNSSYHPGKNTKSTSSTDAGLNQSDKNSNEPSRIASVVERMRTRGREWADEFIDKNRIGISDISFS